MDRMILRCLPAELRERYAEEITDLLDHSCRPVRDRADLVIASVGLRLGARLGALLAGAVVCVCLAGVGLVLAVLDLANGPGEILDHWWSTLAVLGAATSLTFTILLAAARDRARTWSTST